MKKIIEYFFFVMNEFKIMRLVRSEVDCIIKKYLRLNKMAYEIILVIIFVIVYNTV